MQSFITLNGRELLRSLLCATAASAILLAAGRPARAAEDCHDLYFGISAAPDLARALKCYEASGERQFLILMRLNGEGTAADVNKAKELFDTWPPAEREKLPTARVDALEAAIEKRRKHPEEAHPRLDFCEDIVNDYPGFDLCFAIDNRMAEQRYKTLAASTRAALAEEQKLQFDRLVAGFEAFRAAELQCLAQTNTPGRIHTMVLPAHEAFLRGHFTKLIQQVIVEGALEPVTAEDFEAADRELNRVYRGNPDAMEAGEPDGAEMEAQKKCAKLAQRKWIQYRDLWTKLAGALYRNRATKLDPEVSIKTLLTKLRIEEMLYDPEAG